MHIDEIRNYCLALPAVKESFPFDEKTLVFKVGGKLFALMDIHSFEGMNLKGTPEQNTELKEKYSGVLPGYHMNKKHWITVKCNSDVPRETILELIRNSYVLVVNGLPKKLRNELALGQIPLECKNR